MKILALEKEIGDLPEEAFTPYLKNEARIAWDLYQKGIIRELYFRGDREEAVLILECSGADEAREYLNGLPLVKNKLIDFEIIPLIPYPGFERLFE